MESSAEVEKMLGEGLEHTGPYHGPTAAVFWTGGVIAVLRDAIQEAKKASGAHIFRPLLGTLFPSPFQATGKKGRDCQSRGLPLNLGRLSNLWVMQNCVQAVVPETIADLKRASTKLFAEVLWFVHACCFSQRAASLASLLLDGCALSEAKTGRHHR